MVYRGCLRIIISIVVRQPLRSEVDTIKPLNTITYIRETPYIQLKEGEVNMSSDIKTIPLMNEKSVDNSSCITGCGNCNSSGITRSGNRNSTGCSGGHIVKAGSSDNVVYMNLLFFALFFIVMIVTAYLIMKILTAIFQ